MFIALLPPLAAPSVNEGYCVGSAPPSCRTPIDAASRTGSHSPVRCSSCAKKVFTENHVPVTRLKAPPSVGSALCTVYGVVYSAPHVEYPVTVVDAGELMVVVSGMPSLSAAASTKSLKVDPAGKP